MYGIKLAPLKPLDGLLTNMAVFLRGDTRLQ